MLDSGGTAEAPAANESEATLAPAYSAPGPPEHTGPRNATRGTAYKVLDLGLHKSFGFQGDAKRIEARIEAFNLFNHTNFQTANGNRSSAAFGTITSAFPARQLQLGVKFYF